MADVSVREVSKSFGSIRALRDVTIDFANGGFYALLGPSGCGKTTLLRLIAGFDFPDAGSIAIGGERVDRIPVEKRDIGMMFQSYALFPNMSVAENVGFGLSVRGVGKAERKRRIGEALELVRLADLGERRPSQLSGGQRQRVALARAIVFQPRVLLLDEPLSALDKALRTGMQVELKRIQREVGVTAIFVTHDQEEALTMSDRVGILRDGALIQEGPPREIYERPATAFAATFLGDANLFAGRAEGDAVTLESGEVIRAASAPGVAHAIIAVRPEKMRIAHQDEAAESGFNAIDAIVEQQVFAGSSLTTLLRWRGEAVHVFSQNIGDTQAGPGETVRVLWRPEHSVPVAP